jgi:hypothetical protein
MAFFKHLEGEAAVLVERGVYKQADLYQRDAHLYAKSSGGFVRLCADGSTSKPTVRLETLSFDGALFKDTFGRLLTAELPGSKAIAQDVRQKLLGAA